MLLVFLAVLQAPLGDTLTLDDAIRLARERRGTLQEAGAGLAAARAEQRRAGAITNPIARFGYSDDPPRKHATAEQSLEWLLSRGPALAASRERVGSALADSTQRAADLVSEVRLAFDRCLAARAALSLVQAQQALEDSVVQIAERRLVAGDISRIERDQVALEASRSRLELSSAREALATTRIDLARTIGFPLSESLPEPVGLLDGGLGMSLVDTASRIPPALAAALADSAAAAHQVAVASRARVPMPALEAGADWDDPGGKPGALLVLGLSLPIPLWQHGGAEVALARAESARAAAQSRETRSALLAARGATRVRVEESAFRALTLRDSLVPAARGLRASATRAWSAGETGVLPVLESFRSERMLELGLIQALVEWRAALTEWDRLLGNQP
jgi:cobalt-zinc-cadmium efflux system outer membrane protein